MSTATVAVRRNQNLYRQPIRIQMGPLSASFLVVAIVGVLALIYLNQLGKTAILGNRLAQLQAVSNEVTANQQALNVEAARLSSIQQIQSSPAVAQMVPAGQVSYAK